MKVRSITSSSGQRPELQERSPGAAGPQICSSQKCILGHFWVLARRMPLRRGSGGPTPQPEPKPSHSPPNPIPEPNPNPPDPNQPTQPEPKNEKKNNPAQTPHPIQPHPKSPALQNLLLEAFSSECSLFDCCRSAGLRPQGCVPAAPGAGPRKM